MFDRDDPGHDTFLRAARRLLRVGATAGFAQDLLSLRAPGVAVEALRHGLSVRSTYAIHARRYPERLALVDARRQLTYAQANSEINRVGRALQQRLDVRAGQPVVLMMENRSEYLVAWSALLRIGASAVHASYRMTADELAYQVDHSGASVLVVSPRSLAAAQALAAGRPDLDLTLVVAPAPHGAPAALADSPVRTYGYDALVSGLGDDWVAPRRRTGAGDDRSDNIVYTSGTTGRPKGTVRDFASYGLGEMTRILDRLPLRTGDRHLLVAPVYHSGGQVFSLMQAGLAATIYLRPSFDAADALECLHRFDIDSVFMVPTMIRQLLDLPEPMHRRWPAPGLRALVSGAAPFSHELRMRAIERFGAGAVFDFYGATELGWVTLIDGDEMRQRPASVGQPLPGQHVQIRDAEGQALPPGEVGKIWVRNAQAMTGYLRDRTADAETFSGGWATVDDLGYLDADHYLYLAGRARDMVISGGVNIYPVEIEHVLAEHPGVADAAVIGVPDPKWGERLVAVVVVEPTARVDADALESFARQRLTGYKVPRQWEFVDALPRNPTGKILKKDLEARYAQDT